jgi:hypothetical protein
MIRDNLTPSQRAIVAAEGARFAASRSAETPAEDEKPKVAASVKREVQQPVKAAASTLIAIRHLEIEGHVFAHGTEIMLGLLAKDAIDRLIDQGSVREYDSKDRRSLYRLLAPFSGAKEREPLDAELTAFGLQP